MTGSTVDPTALATLAADVGPDAARDFLERYAVLLPARVDHLVATLADGDADCGYVTALSLHSSSTMAGAHALAETARAMSTLLRAGDVPGARAVLPLLRERAAATARALRAGHGG